MKLGAHIIITAETLPFIDRIGIPQFHDVIAVFLPQAHIEISHVRIGCGEE